MSAAGLASYTSVLNTTRRWRLLTMLRQPAAPKAMASLLRADEEEIEADLAALAHVGLVRKVDETEGGKYAIASQGIFTLAEDLFRLASGPDETDLEKTVTSSMTSGTTAVRLRMGPALVTVHGVDPGKVTALNGAGPWRIGRDASCELPVTYDNFASSRHATIHADRKSHLLVDEHARNGTTVNWDRLEAGERRVLTPGDVIGVGRSLFVYRVP